MTSYATALAATDKALVTMAHFVGPNKRFVTRDWSGRTSAADLGLRMQGSYDIDIDPDSSSVRVGALAATMVDPDGAVTAWLETNDAALAARQVDLYFGMTDVAEADFLKATFFLRDYESVRADDGEGDAAAYRFEFSDLWSLAQGSILDWVEQPDARLASSINESSTSITLDKSVTGKWPSSGTVLLFDQNSHQCELVAYTTLTSNGTILGGLTRRYSGGTLQTGFATKTWSTDTTQIKLCKVLRGNPLDLARRLLCSTAGGGNGTYDAADGDGLGALIPNAAIDNANIDSMRDIYGPTARGYDFLFVITRAISNVKRFVESELLRAAGFLPTLTSASLLTVRPHFQFPPVASSITGRVDPAAPLGWKRNFEGRLNKVIYRMDHIPGNGDFKTGWAFEQAEAVTAYKESKLAEIEASGCRGAAGVAYGLPDLGGDKVANTVGQLFEMEFGNPAPTFEVEAFWSEKDRIPGEGVYLTHPGLRVVGRSTRGSSEDLFLITRKSIRIDEQEGGKVTFTLRQRLQPFRPLFVNLDAAPADYGSATAIDKMLGYICPNGGTFADGTTAYRFINGPVNDGSISLPFPWAPEDRDEYSPSLWDYFQGPWRERDRANSQKAYPTDADQTTTSTSYVALAARDFYIPPDCDRITVYCNVFQNQPSAEEVEAYLDVGGVVSSDVVSGVTGEGSVLKTFVVNVGGTAVVGTRRTLTLYGKVLPDSPRDTPSGCRVKLYEIVFAHAGID